MQDRLLTRLAGLLGLWLMASCMGCQPKEQRLAQAAIDAISEHRSYIPLTTLATEELYNDVKQEHMRLARLAGGDSLRRLYVQDYDEARRTQGGDAFILENSFDALGWTGKSVRIASMEPLFPQPPEDAYHKVYVLTFKPPMDGYRIKVGIYNHKGRCFLSSLMWDADTWREKVKPVYMQKYDAATGKMRD